MEMNLGSENEGVSRADHLNFLTGGGEMGEYIRAFDWSKTPAGAIAAWPQSLKTAVQILLNSRYPMFIWWGRELINIYNDAYIPVLGARHPQALGQPAPEIWADIWPVVGPQAQIILNEGQATWNESVLLMMERYGYPEETYFTFSYSPMPDDKGDVAGVFCACTEDTQRVIGERQLSLLRELAAKTADARTWQEVCKQSANALSSNSRDLPFAIIYIAAPDGSSLSLAGATGIDRGHLVAPNVVNHADQKIWPLATVLGSRDVVVVEDLSSLAGAPIPTGAWQEPPRQAALLPITATGQTGKGGVLVVGLNPFRIFDDDYRNFLTLVGGQISASIASAQAYEEEKRRAEVLAELDRAKTTFFSNISHEFRTPLTLMLGPVEEMLEKTNAEVTPAIRSALEVVHRNSLRLLKLVNTMLDFSRIEAGRMQASYEPVDLAAYTTELVSVFRSAIEHAGLQLITNCPPLSESVFVDRDMWEKIVLNLVSNALKFTLDGEIEVRLEEIDGYAQLTVRDTGVGIPAEEMPHIFERFHRVKESRGRTYEGTGIGLALVQELVKLHSGTVRAESVLNEGAQFTVTLPLGTAHLAPERIGTHSDLTATTAGTKAFLQETWHWLPQPGPDAEEAWTRAVGAPVATFVTETRMVQPRIDDARIVWADDNADMRQYVSRLLGEWFEVEAVADGQEALEAARANPPDLILADIMMPRLDGLGLLQALRAAPQLKEIPIILLSARAGEEARIQGLEAGADDYLVKPFHARELLARVESHIRLSRLRREANEALRHSEQRLAAILQQLPVSVGVIDPDGRITMSNALWRKYVPRQVPSRDPEHLHRWRAFTDNGKPIPSPDWPAVQALRGRTVVGMNFLHMLDDGREIWLRVSATPFRDGDGETIGVISVIEEIDAQKRSEQALRQLNETLEDRVEERTQQVRDLVSRLTIAEQEQRRQISQILHDDLQQLLYGIEMKIGMIRQDLKETGQFDLMRDLDEGSAWINQAITTTRQLTVDLSPPILQNEGLADALQWLQRQMYELHGLEVDIEAEHSFYMPNEDLRVLLFQIVRELLFNVKKHAGVNRAEVKFTEDAEYFAIHVIDEGQGFDVEAVTVLGDQGRGFGLFSIRERLDLFGGRLVLQSQSSAGSHVTVYVPLHLVQRD